MIRDGLLLVDKARGPTSHDVVDSVRRLLGVRKAGHTGTLDPLATGLLLVCIGRATRLSRFLQEGPKTYEGTFVLGVATDTLDADGTPVSRHPCRADRHAVSEVMATFVGAVTQTPPMTSAVKVGGRKLYELARQGKEVARGPRQVTVTAFELTRFEAGDFPQIGFEVRCGRGTYVRSLVAAVGQRMGCGAHLAALRRTRNGFYQVTTARTLDELEAMDDPAAALIPLDEIELGIDRLCLDQEAIDAVRHGRMLASADHPKLAEVGDGYYQVRDEETLLAIYRVQRRATDTQARAEWVLGSPAGGDH